MKPHKQNKIIRILTRFDLSNQLAAVAGIASIAILIISSILSQQQRQSDFSSNNNEEAPYPYKFDGTTQRSAGASSGCCFKQAQNSSEVKVVPAQAATTPDITTTSASATVPKESKTPSEASALSSTALLTATDIITPSSKVLTSPSSTTGPSIATKPMRVTNLPQTPTESTRAVAATVSAIPSSQDVIPPSSSTTALSSAMVPSRLSPITNTTTVPSRLASVTNSTTNVSHRLSTPLDRVTIPSTAFIKPSNMAMVSGIAAPSRPSNARSSTASPISSTTPSLNWSPAKVRHTGRFFVAANSSSTQNTHYLQQAIEDANATAFGLVVAMHKGQINLYSSTWRKAQDAIILLRQGKTRQEAARRAGISMPIIAQLIEWGKNRPGASVRVVEKQ